MSSSAEAPGLYLHVPFCARACPYCDFDFEVGRAPALDVYLDGLEREWEGREDLQALVRPATVYLGGGTPSLLGARGLARLLAWVDRRFPGAGWRERTVELNPEDVDADLPRHLLDLGFHRASVGVQTLDATGLRQLGRAHDGASASGAVERASRAGLRTSADLIVGFPGHTEAVLARDLSRLISAGAAHLSVYALTIEPGTPWERLQRRGRRAAPDPDRQADLLGFAEQTLAAAGLQHYEISSYARPGEEALHNVGYWTFSDYAGLGPSAASARFSPDGVHRRTNRRGLAAWADSPAQPAQAEHLDPPRAGAEGLWTGLRLSAGIAFERFAARFPALSPAWMGERTSRQVARGDLVRGDTRLCLAPGRWLLLDAIAVDWLDC